MQPRHASRRLASAAVCNPWSRQQPVLVCCCCWSLQQTWKLHFSKSLPWHISTWQYQKRCKENQCAIWNALKQWAYQKTAKKSCKKSLLCKESQCVCLQAKSDDVWFCANRLIHEETMQCLTHETLRCWRLKKVKARGYTAFHHHHVWFWRRKIVQPYESRRKEPLQQAA